MDYKRISKNIRLNILKIIFNSKSSHIGSCFSVVEIMTVLYFKVMNVDPTNASYDKRDIFIMSKGHAVAALYSTLAQRGFFDPRLLDSYCEDGSKLAGHATRHCLPGIEATTGSLGHGLSLISGMALANKHNNRMFYCLLGDGECNEGSVWEAAMFCAQHKLKNVIAVIDFNRQQGLGVSKDIIDMTNMADRWTAFGWNAVVVDGHNFESLQVTFESCRDNPSSQPSILIAKTIKGKGVSWMENNIGWHYKSPSEQQYKMALDELNAHDI